MTTEELRKVKAAGESSGKLKQEHLQRRVMTVDGDVLVCASCLPLECVMIQEKLSLYDGWRLKSVLLDIKFYFVANKANLLKLNGIQEILLMRKRKVTCDNL